MLNGEVVVSMTEEMASVEKYCNQREKTLLLPNTWSENWLRKKLNGMKSEGVRDNSKTIMCKGSRQKCQIKIKTGKITSRPLFAYNQAVHPYESNAANCPLGCCASSV